MTIFKEISHFNELIGNAKSMSDADQLRVQLAMIKEEFDELSEALELCILSQGNYHRDVRDGIADVLVTTYELAHRLGIDADADLAAVQARNMSKFVRATPGRDGEIEVWPVIMEVTSRLGIDCVAAETAPGIWAITSKRDQVGSDGKSYPAGKLLKPSTYHEPEFAQ